LVAICDGKVETYEARRGQAMWDHRRRSGRPISGTLRYEVLKRARYRCELCGVSADVKALEVDHIRPRNLGGGDEEANLQALCYTCNASRRDGDSTDFRGTADMFAAREERCIFCAVTRRPWWRRMSWRSSDVTAFR
jgi:5-methylcytosine-specific restriction endonuclease McrA